MKTLRDILQSIRVLHSTQPKHKKMLRHVEHGFHTAYLGCYSIQGHMPLNVICAVLFFIALVSWIIPHVELSDDATH